MAGMPLAEDWKSYLFFPLDPTLPRGDFLNVNGYVLACPERVAAQFTPLLEGSGEVLPMELESASEPYVLWNVIRRVNALDEQRSNWRRVLRSQDAQYVFHAERLPRQPLVFCVPQVARTLFTLGVGDRTDFVSRYQQLGLKGLVLKKVWESS
jgi:hypothetical protein